MKTAAKFTTIAFGLTLACGLASANTSLNMTVLTGYSLIELGSGDTYTLNSGPLTGNVLLGNSVGASFSGGNNGSISGILDYDNTVTGTGTFSQLQTPPTTSLVSTSVTAAALSAANLLSTDASAETVTQTFGAITSATTITGGAGLNVINIASINNAVLTISGPSSAIFVFNVTGTFNTNQTMSLANGVTANDLLWNLTGTSGNILQTSGGATLDGTFLATKGGSFQLDSLTINGEVINTDGNVAEVSGFTQTAQSDFVGYTSATPEPGTLLLLGGGLLVAGIVKRRSTKLI